MMSSTEFPSKTSENFLSRSRSESCERRLQHLDAIEEAGLFDHELVACAGDIVYWLANWGWCYDPRTPDVATMPFDPWPKQIEYLRWLEERQLAQKGGLVEKARDAGVSYLSCAFAVHRWRFQPGTSIGFGSRKEVYVDRAGDPDSLFEKLRIIIDGLPAWMRPRGYDRRKHATYCKLINPENGNTITGDVGDDIGRSGRKTLYFVDEAAFLKRAHIVDKALSGTADCRIDVSTPNGAGNPFYTKRFSGLVPIFTFGWRDDPRKTDEWAAAKKKEIGPTAWAQEYEIDYAASVEGVFIPAAWVRSAVNLPLPESGSLVAGQDIAEEGNDKTVLTPRRGPVAKWPISWGQCNTTETAYRTVEECRKLGVAILSFDAVGVGTGPKGTWQSMGDKLPFRTNAISGGTPASSLYWPDGRTSAEKFQDVNAELWWIVRQRFERTYEYVNATTAQRADANWIENHRPEDLISIPNHPQLIAELSMPKVEYNDRGKIARESKKKMRVRGIKSPDFAESLVYSFFPDNSDLTISGSDPSEALVNRLPPDTFDDRTGGDVESVFGEDFMNRRF